MKLKRLLSASILLAALALAASAQTKPVTVREGDAMRGHVKSVRVERVLYVRLGGKLSEGPRRHVATSTYTPDGKRQEQESYAPDGAVLSRRVFVYDDAGNEIEHSLFDGKGDLQMRFVRRPAEGERLVYNGDGSLRERRVVNKSPDGMVIELKVYDGEGALTERSETKKEGGLAVVRVYGPDGVLKRSGERGPGAAGGHQTVEQSYNPDGTVFGRKVWAVTHASSAMVERTSVNEGHNPGPRKTRETREYDSRKNLSKIVNHVWNEATNEYEPVAVTYYIVTYYR